MDYLLDSDSISDLYEPSAPNHPRIAGQMAALGRSDRVFISILAVYEDLSRASTALRVENWLG